MQDMNQRKHQTTREGVNDGKVGDASVSAHARHGTTMKWSFAYKRVDGDVLDLGWDGDYDEDEKNGGGYKKAPKAGEARTHATRTESSRDPAGEGGFAPQARPRVLCQCRVPA